MHIYSLPFLFKNFRFTQRDDQGQEVRYYINESRRIKENKGTTMVVDIVHVMMHSNHLYEAIINDFYRFEPHLRKGLEEFFFRHTRDLNQNTRQQNMTGGE